MKIFTRLLSLFCFITVSQLSYAQCGGAMELSLCDPVIISTAMAGVPETSSCSETADCAGLNTEFFIVDLNSIVVSADDPTTPEDESVTGPEILGTSPVGTIDLAEYTGDAEACLRVVPICYDLTALQILVEGMDNSEVGIQFSCCWLIETAFPGVCAGVNALGFGPGSPPTNLADVVAVINSFNVDPVTGAQLPMSIAFFQSIADGVNNAAPLLGPCGAGSTPIGYCTSQDVGTEFSLVACPLAIDMTTFAGQNTSKGNELTWTTVNETNNEYFIIEKSRDGENYVEIGNVEGAGNSQGEITYKFFDSKVSGELNYYRIVSVNYASEKDYSNIVSLKTKNGSTMVGISITPNPVKTSVTISFDSDKVSEGHIMIMDATGKVVTDSNIDIALGYNELEENLSELSEGLYMAVIRDGSNTFTEKFLKL